MLEQLGPTRGLECYWLNLLAQVGVVSSELTAQDCLLWVGRRAHNAGTKFRTLGVDDWQVGRLASVPVQEKHVKWEKKCNCAAQLFCPQA